MDSYLEDIISEALYAAQEQGDFAANVFISFLEECGFMIVPVEDPTNLFVIDD